MAKAKIWTEENQPENFLKRHYQFSHNAQPSATPATMVLYFTQKEFDDFNAINNVKLPAYPADASGRQNIKIEKREGFSLDNSGLPNTYDGDVETIVPSIVWNSMGKNWSILFTVTDITGGYFLKTQDESLPLTLIDFSVQEKDCLAELKWTTVNEVNVSHFEVEHSKNGVDFTTEKKLTANNSLNTNEYNTQLHQLGAPSFYRLKMVDIDEQFSYSQIAFLQKSECESAQKIYPNPASTHLIIDNVVVGSEYQIYNQTGQLVKKGIFSKNREVIGLSELSAGMYYIINENRQTKFIKE